MRCARSWRRSCSSVRLASARGACGSVIVSLRTCWSITRISASDRTFRSGYRRRDASINSWMRRDFSDDAIAEERRSTKIRGRHRPSVVSKVLRFRLDFHGVEIGRLGRDRQGVRKLAAVGRKGRLSLIEARRMHRGQELLLCVSHCRAPTSRGDYFKFPRLSALADVPSLLPHSLVALVRLRLVPLNLEALRARPKNECDGVT